MDRNSPGQIFCRAESILVRYHMNCAGNHLQRSLREAHIRIATEDYIRSIHLNLLYSVGLFIGLIAIVTLTGLGIPLFQVVPEPVFWLLAFAILIPGLYIFQIYYPVIVSRGRKTRIELDLPYAISYMQALSTTMPPFEVMRKIHERTGHVRGSLKGIQCNRPGCRSVRG